MLTEKEEKYLVYWAANRDTYKKSFKQYLKGLSRGLGIGAAILILIALGWYKRADMEVSSKLSAFVFILAIAIIAVFMAWLYRNYQWEMNEQEYLELLAKKRKSQKQTDVPK